MRRIIGLILLAVGVIVAGSGLVVFFEAFNARGQVDEFLVLGGSLCGVAGVALIIVGVLVMRSGKPANTKQGIIDGRSGRYLVDLSEICNVDGLAFEVLYQKPVKGKHGRPSSLLIKLAAAAPTNLQFNKETRFDRFCKGIGISREHQTGDLDFDKTVYIRGPSFGFAEQYLEDGDKRSAILGLMALGFHEVRLTGTAIEAVWSGFNPLTHDTPRLLEDIAQNLFTLADAVPADDPDLASDQTDTRRVWTILLWVFALLWAAALILAFIYQPIRVGDIVLPAVNTFMVAYSLFVLIASLLLKGASTSHDRWGPLVGAGLFLVGLGSIGAVAGANALGDDSQPVERKIVVLNKHTTHGKSGTSYYARVADWNRPGEKIDFKVSSSDYHAIVISRTHLILTTSAGNLGIEWLVSQKVQP